LRYFIVHAMQSFVLFILPFACLVSGSRTAHWEGSARQPKVRLNGSELSGIIDHDYPSVRQFLGIQYAQPPVGELRWEAPQPIRLPRSVNATAYGTSCTQFLGSTPTLFTQDVPEYNVGNVNTSGEDCLSLSLWTPERATNLPVIVFLYGGGWYTGGQDIPYQIPTQWIQRTKDLIVVVPKYAHNLI
jgi:cholinesterase